MFQNLVDGQTYFTAGAQAAGMVTAASALPAGAFAYTGNTVGYYVEADGDYFEFAGDATVSADFGAAQVSGAFSNLALLGGGTLPNATFQGNITGNEYRGSVQAPGYLGSIEGAFFGPEAVETAGSWSLQGAGADSVVGSFGAAR